MKKILFIITTLILCMTAVSCTAAKKQTDSSKLSVVATNFALYDFAKQLGGDYVDVTLLIKPGTEIHSYEPTAADMILINESDIFLYIGGESEGWIDNVIESLDTENITSLELINTVETANVEHEHEEDHEHENGEHLHEYDEHIWTSPKNAVIMCENIYDALCNTDSEHTDEYTENFNDYKSQLETLDNTFNEIVSTAQRKTIAVGDRFPFLYLAHEYGLEYIAAYEGCSSDSEVSVETMTLLTQTIIDQNLPVVFHIEMSNMQIAQTLSEETGAKTLLLHSCQNVTDDEMKSGATYISLMTQNSENLREALN